MVNNTSQTLKRSWRTLWKRIINKPYFEGKENPNNHSKKKKGKCYAGDITSERNINKSHGEIT
jgi:hypothetical protein